MTTSELSSHLTPEIALADLEEILVPRRRGFCVGVEKAIDMLWAVHMMGREQNPDHVTYCIHPIVHNSVVTNTFSQEGVRFVDRFDPVLIPKDATVVFSAHSYPPEEMAAAEAHGCKIYDGSCLLVTKVRREVIHYAKQGFFILYFGTEGHREAESIMASVDKKNIALIDFKNGANPGYAIELLHLLKDRFGIQKFAIASQTTLSQNDTEDVKNVMLAVDPNIKSLDDICYATKNRQDAVKLGIRDHRAEFVIAVGDPKSKNTKMLAYTAERNDVPGQRIENPEEINLTKLVGKKRVLITSGASVPETQLWRVINWLSVLSKAKPVLFGNDEDEKQFPLPQNLQDVLETSKQLGRVLEFNVD